MYVDDVVRAVAVFAVSFCANGHRHRLAR
jgi:hypothetical protein